MIFRFKYWNIPLLEPLSVQTRVRKKVIRTAPFLSFALTRSNQFLFQIPDSFSLTIGVGKSQHISSKLEMLRQASHEHRFCRPKVSSCAKEIDSDLKEDKGPPYSSATSPLLLKRRQRKNDEDNVQQRKRPGKGKKKRRVWLNGRKTVYISSSSCFDPLNPPNFCSKALAKVDSNDKVTGYSLPFSPISSAQGNETRRREEKRCENGTKKIISSEKDKPLARYHTVPS